MVLSLEHALDAKFLDMLESEEYIPPDINIEENVAAILCSSGTTGLPKGVMVTQKNILTLLGLVKYVIDLFLNASSISIITLHISFVI